MGADAVLMEPLRRALKQLRHDLVRTSIVTAAGTALGITLALVLDWAVAGSALLGGVATLLGYAIVMTIVGRVRGVSSGVADIKKAWDDPYAS